jgi:hypothetical protein
LAGGKRLYLSKCGRITLIKSTLSNLPTYFMSFFSLTAGVANCIEKLQRDFLWGGAGEEFKFHYRFLEGWGPKFTFVKLSSLGKWLCHYVHEREALCRVVVDFNYGCLWMCGVLMRFMGCMAWVYGKISRGIRGSFLVILDLRWVIAPGLLA